jgi:glycosyltransferase involved in cell wall biosynthesis
MATKKSFLVYRDELLGASETFIPSQAESLERFHAFYLGLRAIPGLSLPAGRVHIVSGNGVIGKLERARFKLLGPGKSLLRLLSADRPALIHAHFGPDTCNAISVSRALGIPLVATFHGYDATVSDRLLPRLYIRRRNLLKRHAARFLCVSEFIQRQLIEKCFPAEKTIVHYTGIDTEFFTPNPRVFRSPVVLFVGRLVPVKGCEYLIQAMSEVQKVLPDARLVVIGDGPLRSQLEQKARALLKKFYFAGALDPTCVKSWMNRATVFCVPSITAESGAAEGFGTVFAEAQSMGLPVVSFASGGIPEAVANGETGFLVAEKDVPSLAEKLLDLLRDAELWLRFSKAGRSRVKNLFDIEKQSVALEKIYEDVLNECNCKNTRQSPKAEISGPAETEPDVPQISIKQ